MRALSLIAFVSIFLFTLGQAEPVMISLTPVFDHRVLPDREDAISLRHAVIGELTEGYDCVVLSRSHGDALIEEQRMLALNSLDPANFPYPSAADYLVVMDLQSSSKGPRLRLTYTAITGSEKSAIESAIIQFASVEDVLERGADAVCVKLAELFQLKARDTERATKAMYADKVWAVIPWVDYSVKGGEESAVSVQLTDDAVSILERVLPEAERLAPEAIKASEMAYYAGATEMQAATLGNDIGADYLLAGSIRQSAGGTTLYAFVVRSRDAVVLAGREMLLTDEALQPNFELLLEDLLLGLPELGPLRETSAQANIEEAKLLYDVAEALHYAPALELFLAARMVAQDTYMESVALGRIPSIMVRHPSKYTYYDDWRTKSLRPGSIRFNEYVIDVLEHTLPKPHGPEEIAIFMEAYTQNGEWDKALELHHQLMEMGELDPRSHDFKAGDYLRLLSLTERNEEVVAFFDSLDQKTRSEKSYMQAANHFRRTGDEKREFEVMTEMLEASEWWTVWGHERYCELLVRHATPEERLRLLNLFNKRIQPLPLVQWHKIQAELALGLEDDAKARAQMLLARDDLDSAGFENEEAFRAALAELIGDQAHDWPTAASLRAIPAEYKMYIQPVGDYDEALLRDALKIAGEFFGCEMVVRPAMPAPPGRTAYHNDLTDYNCLPLLRHLTIVRPIPEDAITQLYYVDRRFLVYGRGETHDVYRMGLGVMISPIIVTEVIPDHETRANKLGAMIIRQFRYLIERSQGISLEDAQDNKPCINSDLYLSEMAKFGYCPECVKNYQAADFNTVYEFAQANPLPIVYTRDYPDRPKFNSKEKADIEAYIELVGVE